jgi:hypothetical protein
MDQDPEQASIKTETLSPNQKERGHQNLDQEDESMVSTSVADGEFPLIFFLFAPRGVTLMVNDRR